MGLDANTEKVEAVLLPDGKWYAIAEHSFTLSPYDFLHNGEAVNKGGPAGAPLMAASWKDNMGKRFVCPVSAMLAVRYS